MQAASGPITIFIDYTFPFDGFWVLSPKLGIGLIIRYPIEIECLGLEGLHQKLMVICKRKVYGARN